MTSTVELLQCPFPMPLPDGWRALRLGDCVRSVTDGDWIETKDQGGSDYRLLQVSNIAVGAFRETGNFRYVTQETFDRLRCHEVLPDNVLVARMPDPVGRAWHVRELAEPAITAVDVAIIETEPKVLDPEYLAYYLNSPFNLSHAAIRSSGTTRARITRRDLETFPIPVPPIAAQKRISLRLGNFDRLVEVNKRRIAILEETARLIYREWFVHFRFPGHEDIEFVDSDLGPIPAGWSVAVTADLISAGVLEIGDGYRAKNSEFDGCAYAFVRVKNVREGYLDLADVDYLPEAYGETVGGKCGRPGDCVISMKGTVGRMAFVTGRTPPLIYSPQVSYWRSIEPDRLSSAYLRLWMQSPAFVEQCARVKGATDMADYVNLRDQRAMKLALPSQTVHAAFVAAVTPLLALSDNLRAQMVVLESARDLLLPRLISGELDVSNLDLDLDPVA